MLRGAKRASAAARYYMGSAVLPATTRGVSSRSRVPTIQTPFLIRDAARRLRYTRRMARRRLFGCLPIVALVACAWTGCKDKADVAKTEAAELDKRCDQLARACGDKDKHIEKIIEECKQAATKQIARGCAGKTIAVYDCYEKALCGKGDRVWALDDLPVLAERHSQCVAERAAASECVGK